MTAARPRVQPLTRLHIHLIRLQSRAASARRWRHARDRSTLRTDYGLDLLPDRAQILGGGLVKCQDLLPRFPAHRDTPNLLYLVSSALPHDADIQIRACLRAGGLFVLNQNGVAYPGWHGPGWEEANRPLQFAHARAHHVIYQSAFCQQGAERFLGPRTGTASILHNPVDTAVFTPAPAPPPGGPILLLAGTHQFQYRVDTALDTLAALLPHLPHARLLLAGRHTWAPEPDALAHIRQRARTLGLCDALTLLPPYTQTEAPALFQRAHLLLHTKYNDPCPRLVAEALASGLPVVHSASGGLPELIPPNAGAAVPAPADYDHDHPPAPDALAAAIRTLWPRYPDTRLAARQHALHHLGLTAWLDAHHTLFQHLLHPA